LYERNLNVFFRGVLCGNLEDDVLLVLGNGLLADGLDEFTQPGNIMLAVLIVSEHVVNLLER
jgi:hypothetical protein